MDVNPAFLRQWRMTSQMINQESFLAPEALVAWLAGVQAQDYRWGKWSVGLRGGALTDAQVQQSLENKRLIWTWLFRGTLHFIAAGDFGWLRPVLAPGIIEGNTRRYRQLALENQAFSRSQKMLQDVLTQTSALTRPEIKVIFERNGLPAEGQQLPYLLQRAALDGLICRGPKNGSEPVYMLLAEGIASNPDVPIEEALGRLADRYFASHGPATQKDFSWWSGLKAWQVQLALENAMQIHPVDAGDQRYYVAAGGPNAQPADFASLLPPFDEILIGYRDRSLLLDSNFSDLVGFGGGGMLHPTLLLNGDIRATWNYEHKKQKVVITVQPFWGLTDREIELVDRAAERFGQYQSLPAQLRIEAPV